MTSKGHNRRAFWADKIHTTWKDSVDAICAVGRLLIDAKADLPHGQFEKMVEADLSISVRTVQRLMEIGRDERIKEAQKRHSGSLLPSSWGTLYELTKLSDASFREGLASGAINVEMRRADVQAIALEGFDAAEARAMKAAQKAIEEARALLAGETGFLNCDVKALISLFEEVKKTRQEYSDAIDHCTVKDLAKLQSIAKHGPVVLLGAWLEVEACLDEIGDFAGEIAKVAKKRMVELAGSPG